MLRRKFMQFASGSSLIAGTAISAIRTVACDAITTQEDLDVGRHIYKSLKWNMVETGESVLEKFELLKRLGYDGVELDSPSGIDQQAAVEASLETDLPIEGIVNSTHWRIRHSDPGRAVRDRALQNMRTAMRYAYAVGANSVLLVPGKVTDPERENHDQLWQRSIEAIDQLKPLAESLEIQILIENVGNGFCETPELFAEYIDTIDHPLIGIHFDIGNFIRLGPPATWIRVLGNRIKKLDIKDRSTNNERKLIGEGDADWPEVRKALKEIGFSGWAAAEVAGGDESRLKDVLRRMNKVLGKSDGKPPMPRKEQG